MSFPPDKFKEVHQVVSSFCTKRRANKKQFQRLAGKLNWAFRKVYDGLTFLRRTLDIPDVTIS